jgi:cellulose synthase/poly-beta-1,6-N-acetylglucosamine synthase-like glycosyltransferase
MEALFWISAGLVLYTFLVYPLILLLFASFHQVVRDSRYAFGRRDRRKLGIEFPSVSLVFAAYNEEAVIEEKMRNLAAMDYPNLEVLIGCDGCSDRTVELARAAQLPNCRIFDYRPRSGKPAVLNRLVPEARSEIIAFSDANTMFDPGTLKALVRSFADPAVGCVCGELKLTTPEGTPRSEGVYWKYEVFLKFFESRLGMLVGANGGVFALRKDLFRPLPPKGIVDDFLVSMAVHSQGYKVVYNPEAAAYEDAGASVQHEFHRRVRIGSGNFHALRYTWRLLLPTAGPIAFSYWSHKVFRWLVPFALPVAFASALLLSSHWFYALCSIAGALLVLLAVVGYRMELRRVHRSLFSIPYYFLSMNLALLLGFVRFVNGSQGAVWRRTAR